MKFNKEIKIGFLAIIGIMMSVFSYNYLKGIDLFEKNRKFKVTYSKVDGLSMSNPVTLNGFKIGKVNKKMISECINKYNIKLDKPNPFKI